MGVLLGARETLLERVRVEALQFEYIFKCVRDDTPRPSTVPPPPSMHRPPSQVGPRQPRVHAARRGRAARGAWVRDVPNGDRRLRPDLVLLLLPAVREHGEPDGVGALQGVHADVGHKHAVHLRRRAVAADVARAHGDVAAVAPRHVDANRLERCPRTGLAAAQVTVRHVPCRHWATRGAHARRRDISAGCGTGGARSSVPLTSAAGSPQRWERIRYHASSFTASRVWMWSL